MTITNHIGTQMIMENNALSEARMADETPRFNGSPSFRVQCGVLSIGNVSAVFVSLLHVP